MSKQGKKIKRRADYLVYSDGGRFKGKSMEAVFNDIYEQKIWHLTSDQQSDSGPGSSLDQTREIIEQLPVILDHFEVKSILDIPCGDFNWMRNIDWTGRHYIGGDIVNVLIKKNQQLFGSENINFTRIDLLGDVLPKTELIFCRDCLVHFSFEDIDKALENIHKSQAKYLMMTTFPVEPENTDIITGGWRPLNFQKKPFCFPHPEFLLNEHCTELDGLFSDKSLGVWSLDSIGHSL